MTQKSLSAARWPVNRGKRRRGPSRLSSVTLTSFTIFAQAISFLLIGVLARLYGSHDFALYGLFTAIYAVYGTVASLKLDQYIIAAENAKELDEVVPVALVLTLATSSIFCFIFLVLARPLLADADVLQTAVISFMALSGFGIAQTGFALHTRNQAFLRMSVERFAQISLTPLAQSAASGLTHFLTVNGLLLGDALARLTIAVAQASRFRHYMSLRSMLMGCHQLIHTVKRHPRFTVTLSAAALASTAAQQLPLLVLPSFHPASAVGEYFLTLRLIAVPLAAIISGAAPVLFSNLARAAALERPALLTRTIWATCLLSSAFFVTLGLFPQTWILAFLGQQWAGAVPLIPAVAFGLILWVPASATSSALIVSSKQGQTLRLAAAELVMKAVIIVSLGGVDLTYTIYAVSGTSIALHFVTILRSTVAVGANLVSTVMAMTLTAPALVLVIAGING